MIIDCQIFATDFPDLPCHGQIPLFQADGIIAADLPVEGLCGHEQSSLICRRGSSLWETSRFPERSGST